MKHIKSAYIFSALVAVMVLIKLFDTIANPNKVFPGRTAVFPLPEIIIIAALGTIGMLFYKKIGLPDFDNGRIRKAKVSAISAGCGLCFGLVLAFTDLFAKIGDANVGWPLAILFYIWGAISSEILFRLFTLPLAVWMIGSLIFKKRFNRQVYWSVSSLLALLAAGSMISAFSNPDIPLQNPGMAFLALIAAIVFSSEMTAFGLLKKYGFLSGLIFRLSFYSVWHILWPALFYWPK